MGGFVLVYKLRHKNTQDSASISQRTEANNTTADYENDLPQNQNIVLHPVYQNLNPSTYQSDSVYQSLQTNTIQSDSVYQSLQTNTIQSDSVYQSLQTNTIQSDSTLPPALPDGPRGFPRPAERHSLSSMSWVFPGASSQWGMPGTPLQGDVTEASETDARATSTAPFRCGGAAALLRAPPG
ncbi:hypothetical protein QTP70_002593 [Hemibagrus guttatus]|uniref:Uncharacterized protein n=1 Tax=Hemibagrus guttatus TaxID=175788 RepID=A0AAE0PY78_9TELE|nr:hypothetical protein QTP70_002593 [Hemibagrus guttatus]